MNNTELIQATNPRLKPSYSPNLHKYLKKYAANMPKHWTPKIYRSKEDDLWIGYFDPSVPATSEDGLIGIRVIRALVNGAKAYSEKGWHLGYGPANMEHIPDFWERYIAIGRCAIDTKHRQYFIDIREDRYTMDGDIRTCTWCGAQHKRHIEIKTYTKEIERFEPLTAP